MSPVVHLHIGEPKTGTTYLQAMLFHNQEELRRRGVLVPGGKLDQIRGGHDVLGRPRTAGKHPTAGAWEALAAEVAAFGGDHAVVSMEMLTRASPPQVRRAVEAFGNDADVRVVVTARDVAALVAARWQESVQFRKSWRFDDYLADVFDEARRATPAGGHFWRLHDTPSTVSRWGEAVGPEGVTVVTVPRSRTQPDLLWRRFGEALGLDLAGCPAAEQANPSLGRASAEVMRLLNKALEGSRLREEDYARICRQTLGKAVLPRRLALEDRITLPAKYRTRAHEVSERLASGLAATGVRVVGDLNDLRSPLAGPDDEGPGAREPSAQAVADAAIAALAGLAEQNAALFSRRRRTTVDPH